MATSYADVFRDWEKLIGAVVENAEILPNLEAAQAELKGFLERAKVMKVRQETLEGNRQAMTQQLADIIHGGRDSARKLRDLVRAHLGQRSENLPQFGVAPNRKRTRKPKATPPPQVEDGKGEVKAPQNSPIA